MSCGCHTLIVVGAMYVNEKSLPRFKVHCLEAMEGFIHSLLPTLLHFNPRLNFS